MGQISRKTLEDGKVLQILADEFNANRNEETLFAFLRCLRDSVIWVPTTAIMSERDEKELLKHLEVGYEFHTMDSVRMKPDILKAPDETFWFPIFSNKDEVVGEYKDLHFSYVPLESLRALNMAHAYKKDGVRGFILDPFTRAIPVTFELADLMKKIVSSLMEEEEK